MINLPVIDVRKKGFMAVFHFAYADNKGDDQPVHTQGVISALKGLFLDRMIFLVSISRI